MGQYTSYYLYQKFEQRGEQEAIPVYPNVYSIDADGTRERVVKIQDDPQCGYDPPIKPIYKWVNIPITQDYVCDDCPTYQTRWVRTDETTCIQEGPDPQYRWVNMDASVDYYCEGTTKYYKQKKQVSLDGGQTWRDVVPAEYQKGGVAETESTDCGYVPPTPTGKKFVANYSDGKTLEVECNDNPTLKGSETNPKTYDYSKMTNAVIGNCVTTIGYFSFSNRISLTSVTIPNSVTEISYNAFSSSYSLTSISIPSGVTSIGHDAFAGCTGLTSINIPSGVTTIDSNTFSDCSSLTSVNILSGVTSIGSSAFANCSSLTSVTIPNSVTSISQYAFSSCDGLTSVGPVGSGASVEMPDSVTTIAGRTFEGCDGLTSVTIPDSVTNISEYAFYSCSNLTSATIPNSVTSIGDGAFNYCSGLTNITVEATTPPTLGDSFVFNGSTCPIYVPAESVSAYKSVYPWSSYASRIQPIT